MNIKKEWVIIGSTIAFGLLILSLILISFFNLTPQSSNRDDYYNDNLISSDEDDYYEDENLDEEDTEEDEETADEETTTNNNSDKFVIGRDLEAGNYVMKNGYSVDFMESEAEDSNVIYTAILGTYGYLQFADGDIIVADGELIKLENSEPLTDNEFSGETILVGRDIEPGTYPIAPATIDSMGQYIIYSEPFNSIPDYEYEVEAGYVTDDYEITLEDGQYIYIDDDIILSR